MAPPPQARVLRCCCCRLFQAHQVKKSLKWTCKACGEKQSFLRAYGEGSGADCRRHVQKLNLLQGEVSEMSLRSPEEPITASEAKSAGPGQAERESPQGHAGLAGKVKEGSSHEDWATRELTDPWGEPLYPAQQVRATSSKWEQFLLPPGNSSRVDTEPTTPLQRDPGLAGAARAEQRTPRVQTAKGGGLSRTPGMLQLSWAPHTPTSGPKRPFRENPEQLGTGPQAEGGALVTGAQEPRHVRLHDLFNTGEDFDDIL